MYFRVTLRRRMDFDFAGETGRRRDRQAFFRKPLQVKLNSFLNQPLYFFASGPHGNNAREVRNISAP